jgi:hypothetical protein
METDSDYEEQRIVPMQWSWMVPTAIGVGVLGNVIEAVAVGVQDVGRIILSHVAWSEERKSFHEEAAKAIETIVGGTE